MSEVAKLSVQPRTPKGSRAAEKLRKSGFVPGVVYGHKEPLVHIAVKADELDRAIRVLHARTFTLNINGKEDTVLIKELQWDYLGRQMIHVDFERHSLTEKVKVLVPVELRNSPKSLGGGVLDQPMHQLHVECPFGNIPEAIRVDILNLTIGHPIHVRDLVLPPDVKVLEVPEAVIVQIKLPGAEAAAVDTTGAEPEVLTAKKPKEEAE